MVSFIVALHDGERLHNEIHSVALYAVKMEESSVKFGVEQEAPVGVPAERWAIEP